MTDTPITPAKPGRKPRQVLIDQEAAAISGCAKALESLDDNAKKRVLEYVKARFGI